MSAFLSVRKGGSIEVLSDAAVYDLTNGNVLAIGSKLHQPPGVVGVIIGLGHAVIGRAIAAAASQICGDFDDLIAGFDEVLSFVDESAAKIADIGRHYLTSEIFVAGWSASRSRPETLYIARHDESLPDFRRLSATSPIFGRGPVEPLGAALSEREPEGVDLATDGLAVMEAMRVTKAPYPASGYEGYGVGGFAEMVTISPLAVERRIVRRWPDEVGRAIALGERKRCAA